MNTVNKEDQSVQSTHHPVNGLLLHLIQSVLEDLFVAGQLTSGLKVDFVVLHVAVELITVKLILNLSQTSWPIKHISKSL